MESYHTDYIAHLSPLVVVQGVGSAIDGFGAGKDQHLQKVEDGEELFRKQGQLKEAPAVKGLVASWRKIHNEDIIWDSTALKLDASSSASSSITSDRYRFKFVDQHFIPKVKDVADSNTHLQSPETALDREWIHKYRSILPSIVVSFYELNGNYTEPQEIEKVDLELISEINVLKEQLHKRNVKQLVILVSSASSSVGFGMDERISHIRRQTGLNNRSCLLLLESATPKETNEIFTSSLQVVKAAELDFYSNLEKKLKKKRSKALSYAEDEFTKSVLESRYALKAAFINEFKQQYNIATKSYQFAYENLLQVMSKIDLQNKEIWKQYRILLDITIFHIIRLFFYQGQVNAAYRKFDIHLQSVIYQLKSKKIQISTFPVCNWLSQQFKMLAQLSDLAPSTLVPIESPFVPDSKDPHSPLVLPQSGYLYLQSYNLLRIGDSADVNGSIDPYFQDHGTQDLKEKAATYINLLTFSKLAFQKKDNLFLRSISFVNFQIAEEHFIAKEYDLAAKFYESSLESIKDFNIWGYISSAIYYKLLLCFIELEKHYASVINLLEISLFEEHQQLNPSIVNSISDLLKDDQKLPKMLKNNSEKLLINISTDETYDILQAEVLFKKDVVSLSNEAELQIKVKSNLNGILGKVKFNELLITFQGSFNSRLLKHDQNLKSESFSEVSSWEFDKEESIFKGLTNLEFDPFEQKIFIFKIPTKKIGSNTCVSISSTLDYEDLFEIKLNVPINNSEFKTLHQWYDCKSRFPKIISNSNPETCEIIPRLPNTKLSFDKTSDFAVVGEEFKFPVNISNHDHESVDVNMSIEAEIGEVKVESEWEEASLSSSEKKENDPLRLKNLEVGEDLQKFINLKIPNFFTNENPYILVTLTYTFYVGGDYDVPMTDTLVTKIPVVDPFKLSISFLPRLLDSKLPNAFVIKPDDQASPKPSRFWLAKVTAINTIYPEIDIIDETITFDSTDEDMVCTELKDIFSTSIEANKLTSNHYIETTINNGQNYRNINFNSLLTIRYKRKESDVIQTFTNKIWKFTLPLLDPRVLLDVETDDSQGKDLKLIFMIENPTTRIFSFSLTLADNQNFQTTGTKVQNISVLPLTRQKIEFHATPLSTGWLNLPQLTAYDLNYRVNLPTLLVTDKVQLRNREIFAHIAE